MDIRLFYGAVLILAIAGCFVPTQTVSQVLLSEDFEGNTFPSDWTRSQANGSVGWQIGDAGSLSSSFWSIPPNSRFVASNDDACNCDMGEDFLITPVLDFSTRQAPRLTFDAFFTGLLGSAGSVEVSIDGGNQWVIVDTLPGEAGWRSESVNLQAFAGEPDVRIGFHHDDRGGWTDGFAVDDIQVVEPFPIDGNLKATTLGQYVPAGMVPLELLVQNVGSDSIRSISLDYQLEGGIIQSDLLTGLSIAPDSTELLIHGIALDVPQAGIYSLRVWIHMVNGQPDQAPENDTLDVNLTALSNVPEKWVILQDHTGAWCQFCPQASALTEQITETIPQVIPVIVHINDSMAFPEGTALSQAFVDAYPSAVIDQVAFPQFEGISTLRQAEWEDRVTARLETAVPVLVRLVDPTFTPGTRRLQVGVEATFFGPVTGDLRINLWVTEDSVIGTGSGYDQANVFHTQPGHPFEGAGNPILGYIHRYTLREMRGGTWGLPGIIPNSVGNGDSFMQVFNWRIKDEHKVARLRLIGLVQRYDPSDLTKREILNAISVPLPEVALTSVSANSPNGVSIQVAPNPFRDQVGFSFSLSQPASVKLEIMDISGRLIWSEVREKRPGENIRMQWDGRNLDGREMPVGVYWVSLQAGIIHEYIKVHLIR